MQDTLGTFRGPSEPIVIGSSQLPGCPEALEFSAPHCRTAGPQSLGRQTPSPSCASERCGYPDATPLAMAAPQGYATGGGDTQ